MFSRPYSQNWKDWITQCWNLIFARKVDPEHEWLLGPIGSKSEVGESIIQELADRENLVVVRNSRSGLIEREVLSSFPDFKIDESVVDFYSSTFDYELDAWTKWQPVWGIFGRLVDRLFSRRVNQLRLPSDALDTARGLSSEIVRFFGKDREVKHTLWLRKLAKDNSVVYAGFYYHVTDPSGNTRVKVVFPLPHGSATVVMGIERLKNGHFCLTSAGSKFGDPGFYFFVEDSKGVRWVRYLRCFHEFIEVWSEGGSEVRADHTMRLYGALCYSLHYRARRRITSRIAKPNLP